jgi:L-threonylcarbamoyladenylate synthase
MASSAASTDSHRPLVLRVNPAAPEHDVMARVLEALAAGRVVAYPTDTFYGLGADPRHVAGVDAIFLAKGRPGTEPLPLIASDVERLEDVLGPLPPMARRLAEAFWPGPLTLVVPQGAGKFAPAVTAGGDTIAVRVPGHLVARAVAECVGGLVTSTSANRSGEPPCATAAAVARALGRAVAIVLDGGPTSSEAAAPIVAGTGAHPRLRTPGRIAFDRVLESLQ